jgi:hypothetical protein
VKGYSRDQPLGALVRHSADHKWVTCHCVAILTRSILELGVDFPTLSEEKMKPIEVARLQLEREG